MTQSISQQHKQRFTEMKKSLAEIGSKEGNFIKVEILFYDAIAVAREYGDNEQENGLLAAFKQIQYDQYQKTKALFRKSSHREQVIRRFCNSLKGVLTAGIRNDYFQPQLA